MKKNLLLPAIVIALINFCCKKERSCQNCTDSNKIPVAIAGADQVLTLPTDSILLDGTSSYDPDGIINEWLWKVISGTSSSIIVKAAAAKTVVKNITAGSYKFELSVKDNKGASAKDTLIVTVNAAAVISHPPIAVAGPDQVITLPRDSVTLDAGGSQDPDNDITNYVWTMIAGPTSFTISKPNAVKTQVTNLTEGVYQFELKLTDAEMHVSKDTVEIKVLNGVSLLKIFTGQVWKSACYQPDNPGACWINGDAPSYSFTIQDTANVLPDFSTAILAVWVRMDTSTVWELVPHNCWKYPDGYPQTNFTFCATSESLIISSWFFSDINLAGRKADLKIAF